MPRWPGYGGLERKFLALPNYVQVGSTCGEAINVADPDFAVRYHQSFLLAKLVARTQTGLLLWRAAIQLTSSPNRRAFHD